MGRPLLTLSGFAMGAAAGAAAIAVRPIGAAAVAITAIGLLFAVLQALRDDEVAAETARQLREDAP